MSSLRWPNKDPNDTLDFDADFSAALPTADTITAVDWTISPTTTPELVKEDDTFDSPTKTCTIWLSGGLVDTDYTITCKVTTDSAPVNRVIERDIFVSVRNLQE